MTKLWETLWEILCYINIIYIKEKDLNKKVKIHNKYVDFEILCHLA